MLLLHPNFFMFLQQPAAILVILNILQLVEEFPIITIFQLLQQLHFNLRLPVSRGTQYCISSIFKYSYFRLVQTVAVADLV